MIDIQDLSLWRRTQEEYSYDLKRTIFAVIERRYKPPTRRLVLSNINLQIARGEKVGIIGPNGAGKSTLLKVISGILTPTKGSVRVDGSIAPLIELGAGFDPDLSVIENILYYGVLLGRDRTEMQASVDGILDFAQLFDHANEPLKALSSGMSARLGFAIATETRPDILVLDEVLAVGDESFRRRSSERIARFWDERSTILVVSHETAFVRRMCQRAILLEDGAIVADGPADEVVDVYQERIGSRSITTGHTSVHIDPATIATMEGAIFRGNGTTWDETKIFVIRGGKKHWICNADWLTANGIEYPHSVNFVEGGTLNGIPEGEPIT
jgi:ABC-type polysaccharide/polyol phosphate transport system ATPase subunit